MGRPKKQTVEYFPHYTGASDGKTLYILQSRFRNDGYAFWFKVLELLGSTEGHYYSFKNPAEWQFLLAKTGVSAEVCQQILDLLADVEAIDKELYQAKVIWCQKFVDNLAEVYRKRIMNFPSRPVLSDNDNSIHVTRSCLVCGKDIREMRADAIYCSDKCRLKGFRETDFETANMNNRYTDRNREPMVSTEKTIVSATETGVSSVNNPQSIVDEMKVNEMKIDGSTPLNPPESSSLSIKELRNETTVEDVLQTFRENILMDGGATVSEEMENELNVACGRYSPQWVYDAIKEAVLQNHPTWPYIYGILTKWQRNGRGH